MERDKTNKIPSASVKDSRKMRPKYNNNEQSCDCTLQKPILKTISYTCRWSI